MKSVPILLAAALSAGVAFSQPDNSVPRNIAVLYVSDAKAANNCESDCPPCNRLVADLRLNGYRVGITGRQHFYLVSYKGDRPVPHVAYYLDGEQIGKVVEGYDGNNLNKITDPFPREGDRYVRTADGKAQQVQLAQYYYQPYAAGGSAGSYYAPYSGGSNGGGGGYYTPPQAYYPYAGGGSNGGVPGGGGDYYTPPQSSAYYYQRPYYQQPVYQSQGRMICGPNGCYYVR